MLTVLPIPAPKAWVMGLSGWLLLALVSHSAEPQSVPSTNPDETIELLRQMSLEDLSAMKIETISRMDEPLDTAPGSIYAYPAELIRERGYRSMGELLQSVPGFTVFHRDLQYVVGVRGFNANDNAKVTLLVNGQQVLGMHEQEFLNGPINLDNVERVEVIVGPSSLFYPATTLAATINVITKTLDGSEVSVATGNALPYSITAATGRRWAPDRFVAFSFTTETKEGFDAWNPQFRPGLANREDTGALEWPSYFSVLNGQYGEFSAQAVLYRATLPELNINSASPQNDGQMTEEFYSVFVKNEHPWSPDLTSVLQFDVSLKKQTRLNENGPVINAVEQWLQQLVYSGEAGLRYTGFDEHLIQAGVQAAYDDNRDMSFRFNDTSDPTNEVQIPKTRMVGKDTQAIGFYLDDQYQVTDRLKLVGGVRLDHNTRLDDDRWHPGARAAIIVQPTTNWVSKLMFNRSVRMPSPLEALNEVWGSNNPDTPSKPAFADLSPTAQDPETLSTYEFQNIVYVRGVRLSGTVFYQELDDFITWFQPHSNGGDLQGTGVELTLDASLHRSCRFWANGAWNNSQLDLANDALFGSGGPGTEQHHSYINPEGYIIGSARYTANAGFSFYLTEHLTFSPAVRYFSEQAGVRQVSPTENEFVTLHHRYYLDATLGWSDWQVGKTQMDIRLSVRNLLDNRDEVASQLNGDTYQPRGIEAVLSLAMRF